MGLLALALGACGEDDPPTEPGGEADVSDMAEADTGTDLVADLVPDADPETVAVDTGTLGLRVTVEPFSFELRNAEGNIVLASMSASPGGVDGPDDSYGPPSASWNEPSFAELEHDGWDDYTGQDDPWTAFDQTVSVRSSGGAITVVLGSSQSDVELDLVLTVVENRLELSASLSEGAESEFNRLGQSFHLGADTHFFGLGERFATTNHRGQTYTSWVEEGGLGQGEGVALGTDNPAPNGPSMTPMPIPFLLSSDGFGLWLKSERRAAFHLGSETDDAWRVEVAGTTLELTVFVDEQPSRLLSAYTERVGRPGLPPLWAFGPRRQVSVDGEAVGMPAWRALREFGVPTTTIELPLAFLPSSDDRVDPDALSAFTASANDAGLRVMAWWSPHLDLGAPNATADIERAQRNELLLSDTDGEAITVETSDYDGALAVIDPTLEGTAEWWTDRVQGALDNGIDGFRLAHGEAFPVGSTLSDGTQGEAAHNTYPVRVQAVLRSVLDGLTDGDAILVARAGFEGSAQWVDEVWSGRANTSFEQTDGLPSVVRAGINLGLSGVPFYGADVGGYHTVAGEALDRELYLRWAGFAALSPYMHDEAVGLILDGESSRWTLWHDERTLDVYSSFARLHTRLGPYLRGMALDAVESGVPLMRHLYLTHPTDAEILDIDDQYYLGDGLMVAPVVERDVEMRAVYFPADVFVSWWDGRVIRGPGWFNVDAPLDRVPLFIADGGIVPLLDQSIETLAVEDDAHVVGPTDVANRLDVRAVSTGGDSQVSLGDGTTLSISVSGPVGPPFLAGETELAQAESLADLTDCAGCYAISEGESKTLWITTPLAETMTVTGQGVELNAVGPMGRPRQVRWEVILPDPPAPIAPE